MTEDYDDATDFANTNMNQAQSMAADVVLSSAAQAVMVDADRYGYTYQWSWLGLPIIQLPADILALQEIVWSTRPQLIIETGLARGGSAIFFASLLELLGEGEILAVEIDVRTHNRRRIEQHPLSRRVTVIQGSSIDDAIVAQVRERAAGVERVMVMLDSNHTHQHVLAELEAYAPLVTVGQYLVVSDTAIEDFPIQAHRPRPWGPGDNAKTALDEYLSHTTRFAVDAHVNAKLLMTASPGGYLRCLSPAGDGSS